MTAIRLCLAPAAILMFAGLCCGQHAPLQDPGRRHVETVTESAVDSPMTLVRREVELNEVELHVPEVHQEYVGALDADEMHLQLDGEAADGCKACKNGKNHCEGVCRDPGRPKKPKRDKPGDVDRGDCPPLRYKIPDCQRAGNPHAVAKWAKCSVNKKYSAWFVGGGAAFFRGRYRTPTEGTWGLDYDGFFGHVNNWLTYTRHRKQGGQGAYRTDGEPKVVSRAHELLHLGH